MRVRPGLVICLVLGLCLQAVSALPWVTGKFISRAWTTEEGLPHDSVTCVLQSHDGFLWVGTEGGLARFDGVTFRKLSLPGVDNLAVRITDMCEDPAGRIYVGTERQGLFCYSSNGLTRLGQRQNSITSLAAGSAGEVWIGAEDGLAQWNGKRLRKFTVEDGLPQEAVVSVYAARSGKVWITLRSGVYLLTGGRIEKYRLNAESQTRTTEFLGVYEDQEHELWAFGDTYLIKLREGKRFNYFHSGHLPSVRIWSFHEGRDGRLWIGTSGQGLFQFTDERFRPVEMQSGKRPSNVRAICEDFEGNLWLGTDGGGLVQLRQEPLRYLGAAEGLPSTSALCLSEQQTNTILISFADGSIFSGVRDHFEPYRLLDPTEIQPFARSLCTTPSGEIWIASPGMGVSCLHEHRRIRFDSANGLSASFITYTCASPEGTVWVGTRSGNIYRYGGEGWESKGTVEGGVTSMLAPDTNGVWVGSASGSVWYLGSSGLTAALPPKASPAAYVSCLGLDKAGRVWASTFGSGLRGYDPVNHNSWTVAEELPEQRVSGLVFDTEGNLWLTTPRGILLAKKGELETMMGDARPLAVQWVARLEESGAELPGGPTCLVSREGLLWMVSGGRVMGLDPRTALRQGRPHAVQVESVRVNGQLRYTAMAEPDHELAATEPLRFPSSVRALEFDFTSPCLTLPEKSRFRYRLEGFDADWVEGNPLLRRARYGAIPSGSYCFRVGVCDASGTWSPTDASFAFLVPTPLWRTPWAITLFVLLLAAMAYMTARVISHRRLRRRLLALEQNEEMSRERMRIAQDMHDEIGSKLARISYLSEGVKTELKGVYSNTRVVDSLAETSRDLLRSLDQMVWAVNPRNDSLEQLAVYLCRYAADFFQDTAILCEFRVPEHLPAAPLSAEVRHNLVLAFEEVLTNVLKHSGADRVVVELICGTGSASIVVTDNGRGFEPANLPVAGKSNKVRVGHGIPGLRRRLEGLDGECVISSSIDEGTRVVFKIPLGA